MHHVVTVLKEILHPPTPSPIDLLFLLPSRASCTPQFQRAYNVTLDFMCVMLSGAATLNLFPNHYAVFKIEGFFPFRI